MGTASGVAHRRADRWLARHAWDVQPLTDEDRTLLRQRLHARHRIGLRSSLPALLGVAVMVAWFVRDLTTGNVVTGERARIVPMLVMTVLFAVTWLTRQVLVARAEQQIASGLARRVARGRHVPLVEALGRLWLLATAMSVVLAVAWSVLLLALSPGALTVAVGAVVWLVLLVWVVGLRRELRRPEIAIDAATLVLDERLRNEDLAALTSLLLSLWFLVLVSVSARRDLPPWVDAGFGASALLVMLLLLVASLRRIDRGTGFRSH